VRILPSLAGSGPPHSTVNDQPVHNCISSQKVFTEDGNVTSSLQFNQLKVYYDLRALTDRAYSSGNWDFFPPFFLTPSPGQQTDRICLLRRRDARYARKFHAATPRESRPLWRHKPQGNRRVKITWNKINKNPYLFPHDDPSRRIVLSLHWATHWIPYQYEYAYVSQFLTNWLI